MNNPFHPFWIALCLSLFSLQSISVKAESFSYNGTSPKLVIDVRTAEEFSSGHINGAINIPYGQIEANLSTLNKVKKDENILVYCRSGRRSEIAKQSLNSLGFKHVQNGGGMDGLVAKFRSCKGVTC